MNTIPELIGDLAAGRMVVVMDDENRENEGDLIMAASQVRPQDVNFMARYGRGLICLALTRERCSQLHLPPMAHANRSRLATNFTVSIEAAEGVTTGISAYDRAHTIRTAVRPDAAPDDLSQPGHVFPLMAAPGGVLTRAGHTEAAVDLAAAADLEPAGVLVEILNEDGSMARRAQLEIFARHHRLKLGTIADLIHYRLQREKTIERVAKRPVRTEAGSFQLVAYRDIINKRLHLALVKGKIESDRPVLVRVHVRNTLGDVLQVADANLGLPVRVALEALAKAESGVLVVLGEDEAQQQLLARLTQDATDPPRYASDELRFYGIGAQILADLGVGKMRVLSAPKRFHALGGFGLEVIEYVEY